jgi:hypothetical protein
MKSRISKLSCRYALQGTGELHTWAVADNPRRIHPANNLPEMTFSSIDTRMGNLPVYPSAQPLPTACPRAKKTKQMFKHLFNISPQISAKLFL